MATEIPIPVSPKKTPKAVAWIVIVVVLVGIVGFGLYVYLKDSGNGNVNLNSAPNTNANTSDAISVNSEYEIILGSDWLRPKSNVTNDIFTTESDNGLSLQIILVGEEVSTVYPSPAEYLKARSFEFPSTYTEEEPKTANPGEFTSAKRIFKYDNSSKSLIALSIDVNGILVLFEVSGPSTANTESVANALASTIRSKN